ARDHHRGDPQLGSERDHAPDGLAVERLLVEIALPGDDEIGPLHPVGQLDRLGDDVEARYELRPDGGEPAGEAARRARAGYVADVDAELLLVQLRHAFEAPAQQFDLA